MVEPTVEVEAAPGWAVTVLLVMMSVIISVDVVSDSGSDSDGDPMLMSTVSGTEPGLGSPASNLRYNTQHITRVDKLDSTISLEGSLT